MKIYPAIDLKDKKVVRLLQGKMEEATVYADNPVEMAMKLEQEGAQYLHIVDLDGAFAGKPVNDSIIKDIANSVAMKIQVGGGIRQQDRIEQLLDLGAAGVILGTAAVRSPELVQEAVAQYGSKIVVGIDAKDGLVAVQGWAENTNMEAVELGKAMKEIGVSTVIFTDISRDGMLAGPNIPSTVELAQETGLQIIASGGISSLEDIQNLKQEAEKGVSIDGVIIGKALYTGAFTLQDALQLS